MLSAGRCIDKVGQDDNDLKNGKDKRNFNPFSSPPPFLDYR